MDSEARPFARLRKPLVDTVDFDRRFGLARPRLERICGSLVGASDAADVVHDTYLQARSRLAQLRDPNALEAWLTRIAVRACYDHQRRRRRTVAYPMAVLEAPAGRDAALIELVERLPPADRTIVVLHYGHGYALDEIARLLDLNYATVRSRVARTRIRLFREWTEDER
jgi:RNA polymerase sigma-70 factor (ECF subfamily)